MRRNHRWFLRCAGVLLLASVGFACTDSVGPLPTATELTVLIDSASVHVYGSTPSNYNVSVPFTVRNSSGQTLFYNGFCLTRWEKLVGAAWVAVGEMRCIDTTHPLRRIVPYSSANFASGKGVSGPGVTVPDFAQPGTYRLVLLLYLDSDGTKRLPDEITTSNTFQVMN